jgi:hypothetical protein
MAPGRRAALGRCPAGERDRHRGGRSRRQAAARATLYVEQRLGAESPWTLSVSAEGVSRRATFDDNAVFAPGYLRWDLGLQWVHRFGSVQSSVLFTVQNVTDAFAWRYVGGGLAYAMPLRTFGITLSLER